MNSYNDFQNSVSSNSNTFGDKAKAAWATVPLFIRFIMISSVTLYILSWFLPITVLVNIPYESLGKFQIWRFVTSTFVNLSIFNLIFAFIFWIPDAIRLENTSGTVRYALNFMINSCLVNILFAIVMGILSVFLNTSDVLRISSYGLWPVIMSEITMLCIANPENSVNFLTLPIVIKSKFYPWVLVGFMSLLSFSIRFDLLAGIAYGYIFFYYLRNKIQFDDNTIIHWENSGFVKTFSTYHGFIPVQVTNAYTGLGVEQQHAQNNYNTSNYGNSGNNNFNGKGTVVGII
jgi:membrane associated rhomboid family serine protease